MTKLQKNQLLVLCATDGSIKEYFTSFTNALNSIPRMRVSLQNAINNNIPIIYNDKVCTLTVEECPDIEWGQIERHLKGLNHTTRGLHNLLYKVSNLSTGEILYTFRAVRLCELINIKPSTITNWIQLKKLPVKRIIKDQILEIDRVNGENVKLKDIIL